MFAPSRLQSQELSPLSLGSHRDILTQVTSIGTTMMSQDNSLLAETIEQVAEIMDVSGAYTDVGCIREAGHPVSVLKVPPDTPTGPNGNSLVYAREGDLIIKASTPGYDDAASFMSTHKLHTALSRHGSRVGAPAQLALLRSWKTGQTSIIMERVPGVDLSAYTHGLAGNIPPEESAEAYTAGVRIVKGELTHAIGRGATQRLNDLAVRRQAANILTTGDPREPETQLYVIDQRFRNFVSTALAPLVRIGRR